MTLDELIALVRDLPVEDRRRVIEALIDSLQEWGVGDASATYIPSAQRRQMELPNMKSVTVILPDDLAKQAQAAGLLAESRLEELLRRALHEQNAGAAGTTRRRRRLVRHDDRLVVEALPGEAPISDAEVRELLNRMEW